jgi:HEPN domain-containing protein
MGDRSADWLIQARRNLEQAESSQREERFEWACFAAQQAAELAVKALHLHLGQEAWGHSVARLLTDLPSQPPADLVDRGRVLDNFYVPTRYPNGHPEGPPFEHYGPLQSKEALDHARTIIAFVGSQVAGGE